jgi:hypothetical protein
VEAKVSYLKNKRDGNNKKVVDWLRDHGCQVDQFKEPLDLLVWRHGSVAWVEVKMPGSQAKFTRKQLEYIADTKHNVVIATSPEEALGSMREKRWLSQRQKDGLSAMLIFADKDKDIFTPREIDQAIGKK